MLARSPESIRTPPSPPPTSVFTTGENSIADSSGDPGSSSADAALVNTQAGKRSDKSLRSWLRQYNPTLKLQNTGSVARDHLASERTFLAYVRTSLTIASTGVALVQLFTIAAQTYTGLDRFSKPLGGVMIVLGLFTLMVGSFRYFTVQFALVDGNYPVARITPAFISTALISIIIVVFGVILGARRE